MEINLSAKIPQDARCTRCSLEVICTQDLEIRDGCLSGFSGGRCHRTYRSEYGEAYHDNTGFPLMIVHLVQAIEDCSLANNLVDEICYGDSMCKTKVPIAIGRWCKRDRT